MENFIDYVKICFRSGDGGGGSLHFKHTAMTYKGGPDGGNGGRGGHIILKGDRNEWTLLPLRFRKHIYAGNADNGHGDLKTGSDGETIVVEVPLGTVARDAETGEFLLEITTHEEEKRLLSGGRGGKGNEFFKSSTNQAPRYAQPGVPGVERWVILELKTLADVGLVGFPNAGKSTLLSVVSAANPKIADYAFTTLTPQLGIVSYRDTRSFVMADIPGIIEFAHEGKGLGHRFLRHIERNACLLFMIPCDTDRKISEEYEILLNELRMFNPELLDKPRLLALTKSDLIDDDLEKMLRADCPQDLEVIFISAFTEKNILPLKDMLWKKLNDIKEY
jgi:GTPase